MSSRRLSLRSRAHVFAPPDARLPTPRTGILYSTSRRIQLRKTSEQGALLTDSTHDDCRSLTTTPLEIPGIPKFFRYISERYPCISADLKTVGPAIDNLYIDMNGVVHNCARGDNQPGVADSDRYLVQSSTPRTNADIFLAVFKYLDNLFRLAQPRKEVFLAIDGVAPRAKMNQQRSRRFRSAQERNEEHAERLKEDPFYRAANVTPFDSNCITPGTEFMAQLTEALAYFAHRRVTEDAAWSRVDVILSGAETPGEGEHKIMEYIRAEKVTGGILPNTRHCVYGLDADLIMLGLVTHEPHFVLLREVIDFNALFRKKTPFRVRTRLDTAEFGDFQMLSIGLVREYLALDVGRDGVRDLPFFDIERIVDDFVFIAMLVGNDFLPSLPTADISDGALDAILLLYRRLLPRFGGYLTESGTIHGDRFEMFVLMMGMLERDMLEARMTQSRDQRAARVRRPSEAELDTRWGFQEFEATRPPWNDNELRAELSKLHTLLNAESRSEALKRSYYNSKLGIDSKTEHGKKEIAAMCRAYAEGLCWTLKYYTEGCADWRWFYPYHYAPMSSDFSGLAEVISELEFSRGVPFRPMEQLLSVLPPSSGWCLPEPYRLLMTSPTSPIHDKYPTSFATDLNGKRQSYEAVVLLPFIDEHELFAAMASVPQSMLTDRERERNTNNSARRYSIRSGAADVVTVKSPFPDRLGDFPSHVRATVLELPFIEPGTPFPVTWVKGTHPAGRHVDVADLPTFAPIVHSARLTDAGVRVFDNPSRGASIIVTLGKRTSEGRDFITFDDNGESESGGTTAQASPAIPGYWTSFDEARAQDINPGRPIWAAYPWRIPGIVKRLSGPRTTLAIKTNSADGSVTETTAKKSVHFTSARASAGQLMERKGLDVDFLEVVVTAALAVEKDPLLGVPTKLGSDHVSYISAAVVPMAAEDCGNFRDTFLARFTGTKAETEIALSVGERVMSVARGALCGCLATVQAVNDTGSYGLLYDAPFEAAREPAFGIRVVSSMRGKEQWFYPNRAASAAGVSMAVFNAISGSVRLRMPDSRDELDLGLGIKYTNRGLYIPGFAKCDDSKSVMLSRKAVTLVSTYKNNFPGLFSALGTALASSKKQQGPAGQAFTVGQLFGDHQNAKDAARAAASWIATTEVASLPLVSDSSSVLTKDVVLELEKEARIAADLKADFIATLDKETRHATGVVPRWKLSSGREHPTTYAEFALQGAEKPIDQTLDGVRLGDRVVNRVAIGPVPFGLRGTVVGLHPATAEGKNGEKSSSSGGKSKPSEKAREAVVEVVFDIGFVGAGDLNGRCSPNRGKAVPPSSLLILRPDRDNKFYSSRYAKVASAYAKRHSAEIASAAAAKHERDTEASGIARVAVQTYANVARNTASAAKPGSAPAASTPSKQGSARSVDAQKMAGIEARPSPSTLPIPSFVRSTGTSATPATENATQEEGSGVRGSGAPSGRGSRKGRTEAAPTGRGPTPPQPPGTQDQAAAGGPNTDHVKSVEQQIRQMLKLTDSTEQSHSDATGALPAQVGSSAPAASDLEQVSAPVAPRGGSTLGRGRGGRGRGQGGSRGAASRGGGLRATRGRGIGGGGGGGASQSAGARRKGHDRVVEPAAGEATGSPSAGRPAAAVTSAVPGAPGVQVAESDDQLLQFWQDLHKQ